MSACESMFPTHEGEQHVIVAAQHIVKALGTTKNLTDDLRKILADLDTHLSRMTLVIESNKRQLCETEQRLKHAESIVLNWRSSPSMIWDSGPEEASHYLQAVQEVQSLLDNLGGVSANENDKQKELCCLAEIVLQMAMSRLEEELIHILVQHKQSFEPEYMSFRSCEGDVVYDESFVSFEDETSEETLNRDSIGNEPEDYTVDLINPRVIPDVKSIANVMFASNYHQEFCEAFVCTRIGALDEYLIVLKMEKYSIEDVVKMDWCILNSEIKKWIWVMKIIIQVYLASEKRLCDQILGHFGSVNSVCFVEVSSPSIACLLNFGEAVAMGPHQPEKLFRLLDMYEVLAHLMQDIDGLYSGEAGSFIRTECDGFLNRLGESAKGTFAEFGNAIASDTSTSPFPGGGVHHLTRYVMNYIKTLTEYADALNLLLHNQAAGDSNPVIGSEDGHEVSSYTSFPMACRLRSVAALLESNLDEKSKLYRDPALAHIFLMNNIHYMVEKVKCSELRLFFGDEWIRRHNGKFQQHATSYERVTWSSVLSLLRDDGKYCSNSLLSKALKEKCRSFGVAFEEIYKSQTRWSVPDLHLREDLRISTSLKVVHAYRSFVGRNSAHICDKYLKYSAGDLENLILDLFEGSSKSSRK